MSKGQIYQLADLPEGVTAMSLEEVVYDLQMKVGKMENVVIYQNKFIVSCFQAIPGYSFRVVQVGEFNNSSRRWGFTPHS